jgi:hypothetical protein
VINPVVISTAPILSEPATRDASEQAPLFIADDPEFSGADTPTVSVIPSSELIVVVIDMTLVNPVSESCGSETGDSI